MRLGGGDDLLTVMDHGHHMDIPAVLDGHTVSIT
jgi:hypothetical protein